MTDPTTPAAIAVSYFHGTERAAANIMWRGRFAMRGGRFPSGHPVGGGAVGDGQFGNSNAMEAFRALGYWASCFPEGDGITLNAPMSKSAEDVADDIRRTFGWTVKVKRA